MNADELLDRYVHEVGRNLPCAQRADVVAEIRSLLSDSLDARAAETGQPIDTAAAIDAVRAFGKPDEVAARYWTTRHLIGPDYFPAFVYVARIVLIFLAAIFLVGAVISFFSDELTVAEVARQLFKIVTQFVGYGLMNLGLSVGCHLRRHRAPGRAWTGGAPAGRARPVGPAIPAGRGRS
jgi:hypothetical protein